MTLPSLDAARLVRRFRSFGPWTSDQVVRWLGAQAVGLVLVIAGWYQASGTGSGKSALTWLNLALLGLVVAGGANAIWLLRGRQAVTLARVMMLPGRAATGAFDGKPHPNGAPYQNGQVLVSGRAMSCYHRLDCALVIGKQQVHRSSRVQHERAGLRPCRVCEP